MTRTGVIKKAILTIMTTAPMVTSNLTPEELVKLVDVLVASKYVVDLTQFTRIIVDDMRNTLKTFKTDLHDTLARQVRSVVQQIQSEAQGKQLAGEASTPYLGNTSALGNMGTPYPRNATAPGNMKTLANASTPHPGSTSGNVIYVDANSLYMGAHLWVILVFLLLLTYLNRGAHPLQLTWGYLRMLPNRTHV
jgi:hypothetical protein